MFKKLSDIYESIYDNHSKKIFIDRLAYNLTKNGDYLINLVCNNCTSVENFSIGDYYREVSNEQIIVYGAFNSGYTRWLFNKRIGRDDILCFCDKNADKYQNGFCGKPVISPEQLVSEYGQYKILIETKYYYEEVYNYLISHGINHTNIISHGNNGWQYFDYEFIKWADDEVMIDGGCFDCESILDFTRKVDGKYDQIIAFEPMHDNYLKCEEVIREKGLANVKIYNAGLWNQNTTLCFETSESDGSCSHVVEDGNEKIEVIAIDNLNLKKVTFIKMDIEGSELMALYGATETIRRNRPKLAICIYHKDEDILDIQEYLLEIVPKYRFGIRHYSDHAYETVLYAFTEEWIK